MVERSKAGAAKIAVKDFDDPEAPAMQRHSQKSSCRLQIAPTFLRAASRIPESSRSLMRQLAFNATAPAMAWLAYLRLSLRRNCSRGFARSLEISIRRCFDYAGWSIRPIQCSAPVILGC